jgi:hypothetical protein
LFITWGAIFAPPPLHPKIKGGDMQGKKEGGEIFKKWKIKGEKCVR